MAVFYLIRHGSIDYNRRIPGRQPGILLSDEGQSQALSLVKRFSAIPIDAIYSSPLERALTTALPVANAKQCPVEKRDELNEIDFGKWTGMLFDELEGNWQWKQFHYYRNGCQIPDGELMIEVQQRMIKLINEIYQKLPDKNVLLFSHNDPIKSVIAYFCGISLDQFLRVSISTGSVSAVRIEKGEVRVLFINKTNAIEFTST